MATDDQQADSKADPNPTIGEGSNEDIDSIPVAKVCVDQSVACSQSAFTSITPCAVQQTPQKIPQIEVDREITILIQAVPISADLLPNSGRKKTNEEGSTILPIILLSKNSRQLEYAKTSCNLPSSQPHVQMKNKAVAAHGPMQLRDSTKEKRRQREEAQKKGPAKAKIPRNKKKAQLFNESGLVDVQVTFEHCSKLAEVTGFQTTQVLSALQEDNAERQAHMADHVTDYDPEECDFVFDSDSEEEGDTDLE